MSEKYVVVETTGDDLSAEIFDDYDAALEVVEASDRKCLIIKVESICDAAYHPTSVEVEYHT